MRVVRALLLLMVCTVGYALAGGFRPRVSVTVKGDAARPTFFLSAWNINSIGGVTVWAKGQPERLWAANFYKTPDHVTYGQPATWIRQRFPTGGAPPAPIPQDVPVFCSFGLQYDYPFAASASWKIIGFRAHGREFRLLTDAEIQREYEDPPGAR